MSKQSTSTLRMIRVSPRKLGLVVDAIRGSTAGKALEYLAFSRKRCAESVRKAVLSAVANAENNHGMDIDRLFVKEAYVGKNLTMRRFMPRAKGRAAPIKKLFSQVKIILEEKKD